MPTYVLMLQTDHEDRFITESTVKELGLEVPLIFLERTVNLAEYTAREGMPSLILLNDTGSILHKGQWLRQLKSDPAFGHIPVVVLGELATTTYIEECYRAGASSYIVKPSTVSETKRKISLFFSYWFEVVEL